MTQGQVADAERKALTVFEDWNEVTGALDSNSSWYREAQSCIEDAVHIGIQMALYGRVKKDEDGNILRNT